MSFVCAECHGDPAVVADCARCAGSGVVRNVPFADRRWDEIAPNLWVGGHVWAGDPPSWDGVWIEASEIEEAGFDLLISFYKVFGSSPAGVEEHYCRIPDSRLDDVELAQIQRLGTFAAEQSLAGRKVLVRCQAGLNRASLCASYALMHLGMTADQAIAHIRDRRSKYCLCNASFVDYLRGESIHE